MSVCLSVSVRLFCLSVCLSLCLLTGLRRSRALLAGYVQALQVRYQGAPKAGRNYVEIVGLQKEVGAAAVCVESMATEGGVS